MQRVLEVPGRQIGNTGMAEATKRPALELHLFGEVQVAASGVAVHLPTRRGIWLLAYLAIHRGQPVERRALAGLIWPESSDKAALHNLRQTLAGLRRALGEAGEAIRTPSANSVCLDSATWVDMLEFDALCAEGGLSSLERAVDLYRAPLLEGCEEPFALDERILREHAYLAVIERLSAHYSSVGNPRRSAEILSRSITLDPYRESAVRALMDALAECGEAAAALDVYRSFRSKLRKDLATEPDPATRERFQALRHRISVPTAVPEDRARPSSGIPKPLTPLLGRTSEFSKLFAAIETRRLVTLVGPPGVGKTRLSVAVAEAAANSFRHGARFIGLASVQSSVNVPTLMAASLDIQEKSGRPILETLSKRLSDLEILLLIDNCEHVSEGVSEALDTLLSGAHGLHVLATSRQPLGLAGEFVVRLSPLSTPSEAVVSRDRTDAATRGKYLLESDSVRLFVERTGLGESSETLPLSELETIGSICRRLDGVPLAIELAAARTNVLSFAEIEQRLEDRFSLLGAGTRPLSRHRTLHAAIDWSWNLLTETERDLLMLLSVFHGGCTVSTLEDIARAGGYRGGVFENLANLVDQSLAVPTMGRETTRYSMLESVRQFAMSKLRQCGKWDQVLDAHRDIFLELAEEAYLQMNGSDEAAWFRRLETEHNNLRAALDRSHSIGQHALALRFAGALCRFWDTHGHLAEGRARLEFAISVSKEEAHPDLIIGAHVHAGWMATVQRDCQAARDHFELALPQIRKQGNLISCAKVLNCLGTANYYSGECAVAEEQFKESLAIYRSLGREDAAAQLLNNLGEMSLHLGDVEVARSYLEESITELGGLDRGHPELRSSTLCNLSLADLRQGKYKAALSHAIHALQTLHDAAVVVAMPDTLCHIAVALAGFEEWEAVSVLLGAADACAESQGVPLAELIASERGTAVRSAKNALGESKFSAAFSDGRNMSNDDARCYAIAVATS